MLENGVLERSKFVFFFFFFKFILSMFLFCLLRMMQNGVVCFEHMLFKISGFRVLCSVGIFVTCYFSC